MRSSKITHLLFLLSCFAFIGFVIFTIIIKHNAPIIAQLDFNTTVRLQGHISKRFDDILSMYSLLGSFEVLVIVLIISSIIHKQLLAFVSVIFFGFGHLVEVVGKFFFTHPGPPFLFHRTHLPFYFPSSYVNPGSSYPSGHSYRTMFLFWLFAGLIWLKTKYSVPKKIILISFLSLFSIGMFFTRISLGEHWTSDVVGGILLGTWLGLSSLILFLSPAEKQKCIP